MNKVLVIGSINIDYMFHLDRFPSKGETLSAKRFEEHLGGKGANQAVSAARLGADVSLIGAVGDDAVGVDAIAKLAQEGVDVQGVFKLPTSTGSAFILLNDADNRIVLNGGANQLVSIDEIKPLLDKLLDCDVVLLQCEIPLSVVEQVVDYAHELGKTIILNPAPATNIPKPVIEKVTYLTPNESEYAAIFNGNDPKEMIRKYPEKLVITLGENGCMYASKSNGVVYMDAEIVTVKDTTGAGDTFNGALAYALSNDYTFEEGIHLAMKAAAHSVQTVGAQNGMPTLDEI